MNSQRDPTSPGTGMALEGINVLDVTQVMAGPFCALQLCDMGANVIKVEPPEGDSTRRMSGARGTDSPSFNAVNRGKRGIVLDLKRPEACDAFRRPERFRELLIACEADHRGRGGFRERPYPQGDRLREAQATAMAVALTEADRAGLTGEKIGELLRRRRLAALKAGA